MNGWNWDAIPIDEGAYAFRMIYGELLVSRRMSDGRPLGEKLVARFQGTDAAAVAEALPRAVWARSPSEPRIALVIPTPPRSRIIGVHLGAGFKERRGERTGH